MKEERQEIDKGLKSRIKVLKEDVLKKRKRLTDSLIKNKKGRHKEYMFKGPKLRQ